jgi:hypothetical protein
MVELDVAGRKIKITGEGASDNPFVVTGTGPNTPVAALAEHAMMDHWMGDGNWFPVKTSTHSTEGGGVMAVMTIRTLDENGEVIQGDIYFDVSEAFSKQGKGG